MTVLKITGMTCGHCRMHVQKALAEVAGVEAVTVDLAAGRAEVVGQAPVASLVAAVEAEGYTALEVPA